MSESPAGRPRALARLCLVAAVVPAAVVGLAAPAAGHVTVTPSTTAAGAFAVLEVSFAHGCEGSSTTEVTIGIPEEIGAVRPTRNARWEVEKETVTLDPPGTDSDGNRVTERVASVTYRSDVPVPDGVRDGFELSVRLPETPGATLVFPTIQTCEQGESAWIEVAGSGLDPADLELPAPAFELTAAEVDGPDGGRDGGRDGTPAAPSAIAVADAADATTTTRGTERPGGPDMATAAALGAGLLGVVLGAAALVVLRRRT